MEARMRLTLHDVKKDIHALDTLALDVDHGPPIDFVSNVRWDIRTPWGRGVRHVGPSRWLEALGGFLGRLRLTPLVLLVGLFDTTCRAARLWWASRQPRSVVILNMGERSALLFGLLRLVWPTPGKAIASHIYLHRWHWWKRGLIRLSMRSTSICAVWSEHQVRGAEQLLGTRRPVFLRVPYKANHSQLPPELELPVGDYIFSGGNTERDYRTLFAALGGLSIPVVVSCTDANLLRGMTVPSNVIVVAAREPYFRRLMAGARLVVLCVNPGILRGAGEATFLNALWHRRPVVVADDGSAGEYIEDGVTGFVVGAGDVEGVRRRAIQLWNEDELRERIGRAGRQLVEMEYTGKRWRERMLRLALLLFRVEPTRAKPQAAREARSALAVDEVDQLAQPAEAAAVEVES
jgi:hypothetical protein